MDIYTHAFEQGMKMYWISNNHSIPSDITRRDIEIARNYRQIIEKLKSEKSYKTPYYYERKLIDRFAKRYYPMTTKATNVYTYVENFIERTTILKPYRQYLVDSVTARTHLEPSVEHLKSDLEFYENYRKIKEKLRSIKKK